LCFFFFFFFSGCLGARALPPHEANLFDMQQKYAAVMPLAAAIVAIEQSAR
jgi:maleamate amidohydrolase